MTIIHERYRLEWGWDDIILSLLGLPIAFYSYGPVLALLYLLYVLNALVRKIKGTDQKEVEAFVRRYLEQVQETERNEKTGRAMEMEKRNESSR